jgi:hypothetical protein
MEITEVSIQQTFNLGNYESVRIACTVALIGNDDPDEAVEVARQFIDRNFQDRWGGESGLNDAAPKATQQPAARPAAPPEPTPWTCSKRLSDTVGRLRQRIADQGGRLGDVDAEILQAAGTTYAAMDDEQAQAAIAVLSRKVNELLKR